MIVDPHPEQLRLYSRSLLSCVWRGLLFGGLLAACTLTAEEFQPEPVQGAAALTPEGGAPSPMGSCEGEACQPPSPDAGLPPCDGEDCPARPIPLLPLSCDDGLLNQDEGDVDCGGSCDRECAIGQRCRQSNDCEEGSFCPPEGGRCRAASCADGLQNGGEVLTDCGGGQCDGCPGGTACGGNVDCASGVCSGGRCAAPTCDDSVLNQGELDVDCGGPCAAGCGVGVACASASDCRSGVCEPGACASGVATCCQAPSCNDEVLNGTEPVTDCGNFTCGLCDEGSSCGQDAHCQSGFCQQGLCANPGTCTDFIPNGTETGTDCGGGRCPVCRDLSPCREDSDCFNNNCDPNGICISCGDTVVNGTETDQDCGGDDPFCQRCRPGQRCGINTDCASGFCFNGFCG